MTKACQRGIIRKLIALKQTANALQSSYISACKAQIDRCEPYKEDEFPSNGVYYGKRVVQRRNLTK
ncbi:hypothetical protein [Ruminiclostridium cellulolyticum]|uniref:hypothetical protein n=1 Tax=Ruminiclostridium cellulolyticum TaxID=1521 RepID=UPI00138A5AC7|nr:hypothetical protein [Ruminiclostridium cellulolyticum]